MARNRKLKKLKKSPFYALLVYQEGYENAAKQMLAELVKAGEVHATPDKQEFIPAEGDQKENTIWLDLARS